MQKRISFFLLLTIFILNAQAQQKLFTLLPADSTNVHFNNFMLDSKQINVISYEYFYNGAGVSAGDVNNDGLPDLYFTSNVGDCKLYLNLGGMKFRDITDKAGVAGGGGYKTGAVMVDINNDGWMDIYVCKSVAKDPNQRRNILYINNGNGTFTDKAAQYGIADPGFSMCAYFNDLDNDGDLDLLVLNHPFNLDFAKTIHLTYNPKGELEAVKDKPTAYESDQYYENVGGKFVNHTQQAGLATRSFGLSAVLEDFNNDGLIDIYQANDYLEPDYLFINKGGGKFVNEYSKYFSHGSYSSMGTDYADINNDGRSDLMSVDMLPEGNYRQKQLRRGNNYDEFDKLVKYGFGYQYVKNVLQLNNGNGTYSDISYYSGTAFSDWSWAVLINDFDNDGWKDIYVANGYLRDITDMDYVRFKLDSVKKALVSTKSQDDVLKLLDVIPSVKVVKNFYKNYGHFQFLKQSKESGLEQPAWSYGACYADLDNDGDLELIVNNANDNAFIYRNNTAEQGINHSLSITLHGPPSNIHGFGARIHVRTADGADHYSVANTMKGYLSNNDDKIITGIGSFTDADIDITWPDGKVESRKAKAGPITLDYKNAIVATAGKNEAHLLFSDITRQTGINYVQQENAYIDFKLEPLLPHRFSQLGPSICVADLDGDKLDDIIVGGAKDFEAKEFLQNTDGSFRESRQAIFTEDKRFEDGSVCAVDLDKDGAPDLVVSSGGNDYGKDINMYPVRFYHNDGKGNFTRYDLQGPSVFTSSTVVAACDYNKDGAMDIFVGGSTSPGNYGLVPSSYLLNVSGNILHSAVNDGVSHAGMVKSAQWIDINADGWMDLVLAGEWMPITIYLNHDGYLDSGPISVPHSYGWWNKIQCTDVNGDGKPDIIGGNLGLNTRYTGSIEYPVSMIVSDFDGNGSTDCVISTFIKGKSYPICIRDYLLDQMPYLRKKFLRYASYSNATIADIFTTEQLNHVTSFIANDMYSSVFINLGDTKFEERKLPAEAQFFPVNGIQCMDVNKDGKPDLLLAGNDYSTEVETGRNDAGIGLVLIGDGKGNFEARPVTETGFFVPGDVKNMETITVKGKRSFIVGKNKDAIQVIQPAE
jgi:hypothetical protein